MSLSSLFSRRLVLITGKGGIGKSLLAASLGQLAADAGKSVLIVESASRDQLAPLFGTSPARHVISRVGPRLATLNLEPSDNFRDYVVKHLGQKQLFDKVFSHRVVQSFINTVPGMAELMMLGRLYYECELAPEPRHDLVIFDGAASGHFLSLMTTPDAVLSANLGGPLTRETERVKAFLSDVAKVGMLYVGVPEDLVVSEMLDFLPRLEAKSPAKLAGIVINRAPTWTESDVAAAGPAAAYMRRRLGSSKKALETLASGLATTMLTLPISTLPELGSVPEPMPAGFGAMFLAGAT